MEGGGVNRVLATNSRLGTMAFYFCASALLKVMTVVDQKNLSEHYCSGPLVYMTICGYVLLLSICIRPQSKSINRHLGRNVFIST